MDWTRLEPGAFGLADQCSTPEPWGFDTEMVYILGYICLTRMSSANRNFEISDHVLVAGQKAPSDSA